MCLQYGFVAAAPEGACSFQLVVVSGTDEW